MLTEQGKYELYFSYAQNFDIRIWICRRKTHQAFQKINRNYVSEISAIDQACSLEDMLVLWVLTFEKFSITDRQPLCNELYKNESWEGA